MSEASNSLLDSFLKQNKEFHYNYEDDTYYKVPNGSLLLDSELDGGFTPGLHRFVGPFECGKTSHALNVMKNALVTVEDVRGVYIKAEGRLGPEMIKRSGIDFVTDPAEWKDGTCFIFESNVYETVVDLMRKLIMENDGKHYVFILDSVDGLISKEDLVKDFGDSTRVAGGAVIAAHLMKKIAVALAKRGHMAIFISQVRANISLDPYSKEPPRQIVATGGNALLHFANVILEFKSRFKKDLILKDPKAKPNSQTNPIIGHWATVIIKKSPNEKSNVEVSYPIIYGRKGGNSIWIEKELVDMLISWGFINRKGSWYNLSEEFCEELKAAGVEFESKLQGEAKIFDWISNNKKACEFVIKKFKELLEQH
jgi:recombination protein RecA